MPITLHPNFVIHPGPWLRTERMEPHRLYVTLAAQKLHVTRQAMTNLLNGNAGVSDEMATRFGKAFDLFAETLLRMQVAHDPAEARAKETPILVDRVAASAGQALASTEASST